MIKHRILSLSLVVLLLLLTMVLTIAQETLPTFSIGVLDDVRGPVTQGAQFAVREINDAGGVIGADGTRFRLELVIEPPDPISNAIDNLARRDLIAVLGPVTNAQVLGNLESLQSLGIPVLTPATGDTIVALDFTGRIFRTRAAERITGAALADLLVNELNILNLATVQLDTDSTGERVGFSMALGQTGRNPQEQSLILQTGTSANDLVEDVVAVSPPVVVTFGPPERAAEFKTRLRASGWVGTFVYNNASDERFKNNLPLDEVGGIIAAQTWSIGATDRTSTDFTTRFVQTFGSTPGPIEAATYDAVSLMALAISQPGELSANLASIRDEPGVQGILGAASLPAGELSNSVTIIQLNDLGGPEIVAQYEDSERLQDVGTPRATTTPRPTPTPEGVILRVESQVQNVRTGPSTQYDILGQLQRDETRQIIGATVDLSWVVIEFRGQRGWMFANLLEITGDLRDVPVIAPPPTPTPPPPTATPTAQPIADIVIVSVTPNTIIQGTATTINVTVQNAGAVAAGPFAIAATFFPDNTLAATNLSGLAAGMQTIVQLPVTLTGATGNYNVVIVADLNQQIDESASGEANNDDFVFNYTMDRQLILINNASLAAGASIDLEGNVSPVNDLQYTGAGLNTAGNCTGTSNCIGLLSPGITWDTAHYGAVTSTTGINTSFIANAALQPGATLGVLTAEGRRAVLRVDAINPGISITFTYRVYTS
jgi:ABC-type branched-subunit amino acid transport system substrate-binding protein